MHAAGKPDLIIAIESLPPFCTFCFCNTVFLIIVKACNITSPVIVVGWDTVESTRIEPFLAENRVILD